MRRPKTDNTVEGSTGVQQAGRDIHGISAEQHAQLLREAKGELRADLEAKFAETRRADAAERKNLELEVQILEEKIKKYKEQLANPQQAYEKFEKRNSELQALLEQSHDQFSSERIAAAHAAMETGDYSVADDLFAEIEARNELAVQETARAAYGRGEIAESKVQWHDAYGYYKRAFHLHDTLDHLRAYARMALYLSTGEEAVTANEALKKRIGEESGFESADYAGRLSDLGNAYQNQGYFEEAENLYRDAIKIKGKTVGDKTLDYATLVCNLASLLLDQERAPEAQEYGQLALEIYRANSAEMHPGYVNALNVFASALHRQGDLNGAEGYFRKALDLFAAQSGKKHPDYAKFLNNLAMVLKGQGRLDIAEENYRTALQIDLSTIGRKHSEYALHLNNLAVLLRDQGRYPEARPMFEEALEVFEENLPHDHRYIVSIKSALANLPKP